MPLKTFWMMHKNIDRLMAEKDLRMVSVVAYAQSGEGLVKFTEGMRKQMGVVADVDEAKASLTEELDRDGLMELKDLGRMR